MERLAEVGPLEWLGHRAIEVGDVVENLRPEVLNRPEVATPQQLADQDAEPKFGGLGVAIIHSGQIKMLDLPGSPTSPGSIPPTCISQRLGAAVGGEAFDAAWTEGKHLPWEQAIAQALSFAPAGHDTW
jgi:hypothetical protein